MSNGTEKEFPEGIWFKDPHEGAPDFIIGSINIKRQDFMKFIAEKDGDYLNLKVVRSRKGKPYLEVDNWKPTNADKPKMEEKTEKKSDFDDDIPF